MSLEYAHLSRNPPPGEQVTIDRHLYLTEDKARVVEEGDPEGRWLWASPGTQVPKAEAERLGAATAEPKQRQPRQNKARRPAADK